MDVATLDASSTFCRRSSPPMFGVARRFRFRNLSERRTFDISRRCRLREWFHSSRVSFLRLVRCIICPLVQGRKRWPEAVSAVQEVPAQLQCECMDVLRLFWLICYLCVSAGSSVCFVSSLSSFPRASSVSSGFCVCFVSSVSPGFPLCPPRPSGSFVCSAFPGSSASSFCSSLGKLS